MANISKQKRDRMLAFLGELKKTHSDDASIRAFNEIENHLKEKKYGLVWEEHTEEVDELLQENIPVFCEDKERRLCKDENLPWNFIIEGDNLQALYLLEKTHRGEIDCILIDPPYNTGEQDFIYDDNYVDKEDAFLHSKWLSFMEKRLKIVWNLLSKSGMIFIHIDDNEQANLKLLCDELFGEDNFVNSIAIKMSEATGVKMTHAKKRLPKLKEYILVYKKSEATIKKIQIPKEKWDSEYKILVKNISMENIELIKEVLYSENPTETDIVKIDELVKTIEFGNVAELFDSAMTEDEKNAILYQNAWRIVRDVATTGAAKMLADEKRKSSGNAFFILTPKKKVYFIRNGYNESSSQPRIKLLFADNYLTVSPGDFWQDIKTTGLADEGGVDFTNGKKPLKSEMRILELINNPKAKILDFFAGSGTTGEAVARINQQDGGTRQCILVTNNILTPKNEVDYLVLKGKVPPAPSKKSKNKYNEWLEVVNKYKKSEEYKNLIQSDDYKSLGLCRAITYKRLSNIVEEYKVNFKYFTCKWTPRKPEDYLLSNALCLHIKEMIELQTAKELDGKKNVLILNRDDFNRYILNEEIYEQIENIWLNQNMILSLDEMKLLNEKGFKYIPREYFGQELREAAE